MSPSKIFHLAPIALALTMLAACPPPADYYAGRTIDLLIGAPPGGGYDIVAQARQAITP